MKHAAPILAAALLVAAVAPADAQEAKAAFAYAPTIPAQQLAAIKAATEKYKDFKVAEAEGYVLAIDMCVTSPMEGLPPHLGAMGLHYARMDLVKPIPPSAENPRVQVTGMHQDFTQPAVLMYEPQADGSLVLTGIENVIGVKAWKDAGNTSPPNFNGYEYFLTIDNPATEIDEAHGFEPHYELHWWLYRENPNGAFNPWNAAISCANWKGPAHKH